MKCGFGLTLFSVMVLSGCGGAVSNGSSGGVPARTTGTEFVAVNNRTVPIIARNTNMTLNGLTGTATMNGFVSFAGNTSSAPPTSKVQAPVIAGKSTILVNFGSGQVTGTASEFVEAVVSLDPAKGTTNPFELVQVNNNLDGQIAITGTAAPRGLTVNSSGTLTGNVTQGGSVKPGMVNVNTTGTSLGYFAGPVFTMGGGNVTGLIASGSDATTGVTFTQTGGSSPASLCPTATCAGGTTLQYVYEQ